MAPSRYPRPGFHARYMRTIAPTSLRAGSRTVWRALSVAVGQWHLTFAICSMDSIPFFIQCQERFFNVSFCFSVDILSIFNYCLYPWCLRVSAETMRRPGERPWDRRALQGAGRARAEGELTCVNVLGLSLTTSNRTSL